MNPYKKLPQKAFWRPAVAEKNMFDIKDLWDPKFNIKKEDKIATFGSCFAQHIGKALLLRNFSWLTTEDAPPGFTFEQKREYNYNVFTCRTGNIYTTSLLKQWVEWALGKTKPPLVFWENKERYFDPFRPNIEPNGFISENEMYNSRNQAIKSFKEAIEKSDVFTFTLGLTECWFDDKLGYEYPMCPGTVAGSFDSKCHIFKNQKFDLVYANLLDSMKMMKQANNKLKFLLTVSPVPLTATNSGNHILVATMESKSVLRSVAGQFVEEYDYVDYFPSYEIINSTPFRGIFFEPNQRSVNPNGVRFVMNSFFNCLNVKCGILDSKKNDKLKVDDGYEDEICEEELLEAFGH